MFWRTIHEDELEECLSIHPLSVGHEAVGWDRALAAWRKMLQKRSCKCIAVVSEEPIQGHRIMAFGATVFVAKAFADAEIADPRPGLNSRIIASIDSGMPVALSDAQLRRDNTYGGLDMVGLYTAWRQGVMTPKQITDILLVIAAASREIHAGYRLRRSLMEATDLTMVEYARTWVTFRRVSTFEEYYAKNPGTWGRDRALYVMDSADALTTAGTHAAYVFHYREPILQLRDADQQLLEVALRGSTDEETCQVLGMKLSAIKKRWAALFHHIAKIKPELLPGTDDGDRQTRGPQKRHRLLAYLREHPEELRPVVRSRRPQ